MTNYIPPKVWTWENENGGKFAHINRPIAGPTHDADLPRGKHPLQLYSLGTPNGQKVTIMLEELLAAGIKGAEYDAWMISIQDGDQFSSGFVAVNPNSKIPALLDISGEEDIRVFESGSILLYLARKFSAFIPQNTKDHAECMSWLFWQMSTGPLIGGGFGHFYCYAPEKIEYAIDRYAMETKRLLDVADRHLAQNRYFVGDTYTIADIAIYGWFGSLFRKEAYEGSYDFLDLASYTNVARWTEELWAREAVRRGVRVNRDEDGYICERHSAADLDQLGLI